MPAKGSENRRSSKPLMEKRRRARINQSLTELKNLVIDSSKKENTRHNKLEKADILEMTVKHLQLLQRQRRLSDITSSPVTTKFRAGFVECIREVSHFVNRLESLEEETRVRLLEHLNTSLNGIQEEPTSISSSTPPLSTPRSDPVPYCSPGEPDRSPAVLLAPFANSFYPVLASQLPSGELAFVVPGGSYPPFLPNSPIQVTSISSREASPAPEASAISWQKAKDLQPIGNDGGDVWRPW